MPFHWQGEVSPLEDINLKLSRQLQDSLINLKLVTMYILRDIPYPDGTHSGNMGLEL